MYSRLKTVPNTFPMSLGPATLVASDQLKPLMRDSRARRYLNPEATMKTVLTALALLVSTLAPAHAGGVHATAHHHSCQEAEDQPGRPGHEVEDELLVGELDLVVVVVLRHFGPSPPGGPKGPP